MPQYVDPAVSRAKFDREIAEFLSLEKDYRERGWFMIGHSFPRVLVLLAAPQLTPPAIVTGVSFDYTNYDAEPPSVRLVNPFTSIPYTIRELPTVLKRQIEASAELQLPHGLQLPPGARARLMTQQTLMQGYGPDDVPFLCLAGVREYHAHPGHSGDAWELHRRTGAGRLVRLLDTITKYGVAPISEYTVSLVPQITGFGQSEVPA